MTKEVILIYFLQRLLKQKDVVKFKNVHRINALCIKVHGAVKEKQKKQRKRNRVKLAKAKKENNKKRRPLEIRQNGMGLGVGGPEGAVAAVVRSCRASRTIFARVRHNAIGDANTRAFAAGRTACIGQINKYSPLDRAGEIESDDGLV